MRLRAEYNANDEFKEIVDIYEILTVRRGKDKCAVDRKSYVCSIHVDALDNHIITEILDEGGTPEFSFSDLDIEDVDGVLDG